MLSSPIGQIPTSFRYSLSSIHCEIILGLLFAQQNQPYFLKDNGEFQKRPSIITLLPQFHVKNRNT